MYKYILFNIHVYKMFANIYCYVVFTYWYSSIPGTLLPAAQDIISTTKERGAYDVDFLLNKIATWGGGFKYVFNVRSLLGKMIQFDEYFFKGVEATN